MPITLFDGALIALMLVSGVLAMIRGFSREILSIGSWVAAAAAAYMLYKRVSPIIAPYTAQVTSSKTVADLAAAGLVFVVVLILVSLITMKIADFIADSRVGALDRTLGFVFGAARGVLLVVVALLFYNWLVPNNQPAWIADAKSKPVLESLGERLVAALPENAYETLDRLKPEEDDAAGGEAEDGGATGEGTTGNGATQGN